MKRLRLERLANNTKLCGTQTVIRPSSTEDGEMDKRKYYTRSRKTRRAQARLAMNEYITACPERLTFQQWVKLGYEPVDYGPWYTLRYEENPPLVTRRKRWRDLNKEEKFLL